MAKSPVVQAVNEKLTQVERVMIERFGICQYKGGVEELMDEVAAEFPHLCETQKGTENDPRMQLSYRLQQDMKRATRHPSRVITYIPSLEPAQLVKAITLDVRYCPDHDLYIVNAPQLNKNSQYFRETSLSSPMPAVECIAERIAYRWWKLQEREKRGLNIPGGMHEAQHRMLVEYIHRPAVRMRAQRA